MAKLTQSIPEAAIAGTSPDPLLARFPAWTLAHWCVIVFAASFLVLAVLPEGQLQSSEVSSGAEAVLVARSLAFRGDFADPFASMRTGPTAHVAPVYPFLYSLVLRGFGTGAIALRICWAANMAFFALQMALLPFLSHRIRLGVLPGLVAAALGTLSLYTPMDTRWESFLAGTLLLLACLATNSSLQRPSPLSLAATGVLWGILLLTNPVTTLLLFAWPACVVFTRPPADRKSCWGRGAIIMGFALLTITPWVLRDYQRFKTVLFIRDNLGLELFTSNNDCAAPSIRENIASGCQARTHPNPNAAFAAQLAARGEVQFSRDRLHDASLWIADHPATFFRLTLQRLRLFWFPSLHPAWEAIPVWLITLLSVPGLWLLAGKNRAAAYFTAAAWLLFPLIYYVTQFEPRYRFPIYWTSLLPAACALLELRRFLPSGTRTVTATSASHK